LTTPSGGSPDAAATPPAHPRLIEFARRAGKWIAALLAAGLVLPALTKQWTDNQHQDQLKSELTTRLASAVAKAATDGGFLLGDQILYGKSQPALIPAYEEALATWKSEATAIEAQFRGYFAPKRSPGNDELVTAMHRYSDLVEAYIAYCLFYNNIDDRHRFMKNFNTGLNAMRVATGGEPRRSDFVPRLVTRYQNKELPADRLAKTKTRKARNELAAYKENAQNVWADNIVAASAPIIGMTNERQVRGFEVGAGVFLRKIFYPFG
jgi:hypothetical protein